jgi:uncharacterized protein (DUF1330 family)
MNVENAIMPTSNQMQGLMGRTVVGRIVMVNLLKFRDNAVYKDGRTDNISGAEAYMRYAKPMKTIVERVGGRFVFNGKVQGLVVGDVGELWDAVGLVEYPSSVDFMRVTMLPEVHALSIHREAGLAGQLLIQTTYAH